MTPEQDATGPEFEKAEALARSLGDQPWQLDAEADTSIPEPQEEIVPVLPEPTSIEPASTPDQSATPPRLENLIEAMLFVGGSPLTEETACGIVRGLEVAEYRRIVDSLAEKYQRQQRPYEIHRDAAGVVVRLRSRYRTIRERLSGSPRDAKLAQPALDVLSLVAYRQPISRSEVDGLRGSDSAAILRSLLRLGLISMLQRSEASQKDAYYVTTLRFLEVFNLRSLEDLPRLGEPELL